MAERIFVAVAWPYANGPRHLGHVAGMGTSDVFARYHRLRNNDVLMVSGTDENGTPNLIQADREGLTPKQTVDKYNRVITDDFRALAFSYDLFTRTTTRNHTVVVQDVFKTLYDKGYLIKKTAMGALQAAPGMGRPPRQAALRLVRRGHRILLRQRRVGRDGRPARCLARLVAGPGVAPLLLHGCGQHRLPHDDLAEHAARLRQRRKSGRRSRPEPTAAIQRRLHRHADHERIEAVDEPRTWHLRAGLPVALRRRSAPLLPRPEWTRDCRH